MIRRPVKPPGPMPTASRSRRDGSTRASRSAAATRREPRFERDVARECLVATTISPSRTTAAENRAERAVQSENDHAGALHLDAAREIARRPRCVTS